MKLKISTAILVQSTFSKTIDTIVQKLNMQWDLSNNCGPRPSWLKLDAPEISSGLYSDSHFCDIIDDQLYIPGYSCSGSCPDGVQRAQISCDCHSEMGPLQFIKQCEWTYQDSPCASHSENFYDNFDWECNPLLEDCAEGQYDQESENGQSDYLEPAYMELENRAEKLLLDMHTNFIAKTTVASETERITEQEKPEIWLKNKQGMNNWSVERLLTWANRKKMTRHVSSGVQKVVDKILELYGPKNEVVEIPEVSEIARMRINEADEMQRVSNYYLMHQKEENDNLEIILKLQNKFIV
ncbi:unnamed protein product [Oikopleura dioica]|uniref:Uncharacterized protein n=1 Tax=Oikopleura dioica TaxID=34765 RepID=E4X1D6_OIKDI|nr:unnamed protein product [Oikopleura dioica]